MRRSARVLVMTGLCGLSLVSKATADVVLYDGNGFETSANAAKNFSSGLAGTGLSLVGQPATAADPWAQDSGTAATVSATVGAYVGPTNNNFQYTQVRSIGPTGAEAGYFYPTTYIGANAYDATGQKVAIRWTMTTSTGAIGNPFFGIDAYGLNPADPTGPTLEIARFGVNATTGALVANDQVLGGFTATPGTFTQYELMLDYATQTFSVYTAPAVVGSTFTLQGTGAFYNAVTTFTDADIASFGLNLPDANNPTGTPFAGIAVFDNYSVTAVPEPALAGLAAVASGLLLRRKSVRCAE